MSANSGRGPKRQAAVINVKPPEVTGRDRCYCGVTVFGLCLVVSLHAPRLRQYVLLRRHVTIKPYIEHRLEMCSVISGLRSDLVHLTAT